MEYPTIGDSASSSTSICWDYLWFYDSTDILNSTHLNSSSHETSNETTGQMSDPIKKPHYAFFDVLLPVVCCLGIVGNILNLIVLTRRRMLSLMERLERAATYGLIALAVSDMMVCGVVFPHVFVSNSKITVRLDRAHMLYYTVYGIALINMFVMASTWIIVVITVSRYFVVVYPLKARRFLSGRRMIVVLAIVYLASLCFTLPYFLHLRVRHCQTLDGVPMAQVKERWSRESSMFRFSSFYTRWVWPVCMVQFVPVIILVGGNITLIRELRRAARERQLINARGRALKRQSHRVTLTLVGVIVMFLALATPSEVLKYIHPYRCWGDTGYAIAQVANLLQTLNFACNFLMYCAINSCFRRTLWETVCWWRPIRNIDCRVTSLRCSEITAL